ncbi:MAG: type I CRISPR-associated protein Cas8a1/Csx8 [Ruminococcus sp.]|nr:type I CRISPR-associated protein Cas8a1/Csx8 [Ruminococcus sp.]MDD6710329.1 type I CRISPR-associated protein Cas8a1/Csx8 [Ruminococcus sp.]
MKTNVDYKGYDTLIQPTDWRYSATCLGLHRFLTYSGFDFKLLNDCEDTVDGEIYGFDGILYHSSDLTEENYLLFAENFFKKDMTHLTILSMLENAEFTDENIKTINDLIKSKTVLKKLVGKIKFDGTNKDVISNLINENRFEIIKSIFRYGKNLYSDYCNSNLLLTDSNNHCRLVGYSVDEGRKTRFLGFCFSKESVDCNDEIEFDFIPFAFSNPEMYETYFVNNNYSIKELVKTNDTLSERLRDNEKKNSKTRLLSVLQQADNFINYDVEIIEKNRDNDYYSTLFVRTERLRALKQLSDKSLSFTYKIAEDYWLNLEKEVFERCLNNVLLDDLIERMLKISLDSGEVNKTTVRFRTNTLVDINVSWKGSMIMSELENAKKLGFVVSQKLIEKRGKNKISSYQQRIISALVAHDYDRVKEVLLSLSAYSGVEFAFFYKFLEDAEQYKDLAFAFASSLTVPSENKNM